MKKGLFITFEGPDGSGKTTVAKKVVELLKSQGYDVVHTREPGGIDIAEQIRSVILNPKNTNMDLRTEALLFAASRRQHLVERVIPAVKEGKIVICERFVDSSLAYQGYARGIGIDEVLSINEFAINGYYPDLTIYLDVSSEKGLSRVETRGNKDRLDAESINFHSLVVQGYQEVLKRFKDRIVIVNGEDTIEEVTNNSIKEIKKLLND